VIAHIDFKASERVRAAIAGIGRTEDVRFSPDNRLLAIAGYGRNRCLILRIAIERGPGGPEISIGDHVELTSPSIGEVHGVDFIDNETIVVANRDGLVAIFRLPRGEFGGRHMPVVAVREISGSHACKIETPGSVAVKRDRSGLLSLLVCNNFTNRVTRHVLGPPSYRSWRSQVLLTRGLDIPDGIAFSHDGRWIAVSSHNTNDIKMFHARRQLGPEREPDGILRDANFPHGLRFTADGLNLLATDAGGPVVNVYSTQTDWRGSRAPSQRLVVLDDETFVRGRTIHQEGGLPNPQEGGPKGIDIDRSGHVVALTCEEMPLAFFPLAAMLARQPRTAVEQAIDA